MIWRELCSEQAMTAHFFTKFPLWGTKFFFIVCIKASPWIDSNKLLFTIVFQRKLRYLSFFLWDFLTKMLFFSVCHKWINTTSGKFPLVQLLNSHFIFIYSHFVFKWFQYFILFFFTRLRLVNHLTTLFQIGSYTLRRRTHSRRYWVYTLLNGLFKHNSRFILLVIFIAFFYT